MKRQIKLLATFALLPLFTGCSVVGSMLETSAEIVVGAAELILQQEMEAAQYAPVRYRDRNSF